MHATGLPVAIRPGASPSRARPGVRLGSPFVSLGYNTCCADNEHMPDRRTAVLEAAIQLLAEGGAKGLSHRAIDRALRIPLGSTANYFPTRQSLVEAILLQIEARDLQAYHQIDPGTGIHDVDDVVATLVSFVRVAALEGGGVHTRARLALASGGGVDLSEHRRRQVAGLAELVTPVGAPDPYRVALTVSALMDGTVLHLMTGQPELDEEATRLALRTLLGH